MGQEGLATVSAASGVWNKHVCLSKDWVQPLWNYVHSKAPWPFRSAHHGLYHAGVSNWSQVDEHHVPKVLPDGRIHTGWATVAARVAEGGGWIRGFQSSSWFGSILARVTGLDLVVCAGHAVQICCEEDLSEMWKSPGVTGYARGHRADPYAIDPQVYLSLYPLLVCPLKSTQDLPTSRVQNLESDIGSHPWIFPWFCHGCTPRSTLEPKDPLLSLDPISGSVPWTHPQIWLWTLPLDPALDPFLSMDLPLGLLWIWTCWIFSWRLNLDLPLNPLFDPPWISPGSFLDVKLLDPLLELDLILPMDALWMLPRSAPGSPLDSLVPP